MSNPTEPLDPLDDFSVPEDADLHVDENDPDEDDADA